MRASTTLVASAAAAAWAVASVRPPPARVAELVPAPAPPRLRRGGARFVVVAAMLAVDPVVGVGAATALFALPRLHRRRTALRRQAALVADLPGVVDLLALAVGAGLTVPQAVRAVVARADGPLAAELARVAVEADRGRRWADALDELPARAGAAARPLAAALSACERYGAPVADALDRLAVEAREAQRRRMEQGARRVPVLLLFPLVLCILPAFALLVVAPLLADAVSVLRL